MSENMKAQPFFQRDSTSAPNLALLQRSQTIFNQPTLSSVHLQTPKVRQHVLRRESRRLPVLSEELTYGFNDENGSELEEKAGPIKMSRAERKRIWRKNLSAEKTSRLRERDAMRKRVERVSMTPEKRKDLRTKDTARKAALRKSRRMNGASANLSGNLSGNGQSSKSSQEQTSSIKQSCNEPLDSGGSSHQNRDRNRQLRFLDGKSDGNKGRISIASLLN